MHHVAALTVLAHGTLTLAKLGVTGLRNRDE